MKTDTNERIFKYIKEHRQATASELGKWLGISQVAVHKQLKNLVDKQLVKKWGKPPRVFYVPKESED